MSILKVDYGDVGGSEYKVYEEDITLSRSEDTPIDLGWEPKWILMWDNRNLTSYPTMYGYCKNADFMGSNNTFLGYSQSSTFRTGTLGNGDFQDNARGSIKSVSSTGCIINKVTSNNYGVGRHIVIVG